MSPRSEIHDPPRAVGRTDVWVDLTIATLALAVRVAYLLQVRSIAFFDYYVGDAASYDAWAQRIAAGDAWGSETFYQAPAYPYFLGLAYTVIGRDPLATRLVQAGLGAAACVLLARSGRRFFNARIGTLAGVLLAVYPPAIFFDGLVQKTSLGLVLLCALLAVMGRLVDRPRLGWWILAGVILGVFGCTRENALILTGVLLCWIAAWRGVPRRRRLAWAGALVGGLIIVLGPVAARNRVIGGDWAITTVQAGPNFFIGNHAGATGRYVPLVRGHESPPFERTDARRLAEAATGADLSDGDVSAYWWRQAGRYIASDPLGWCVLLGKKVLLTFNVYEITDTEGYNVYRDYAPLLGVLDCVLHFGVIVPLAAAGVVLTWSVRRRCGVLLLAGVALIVAVAAFYVFARYRFPLVPLALLFASAGVIEGLRAWRRRDGKRRDDGVDQTRVTESTPAGDAADRVAAVHKCGQYASARRYPPASSARLGWAMVALVLAAVVANWPLNPTRELNAMGYANLGAVLGQQGQLNASANVLALAVEQNPASAELQYNLGLAYRLLGRPADAVEALRSARRLDPTLMEVDYQMGAAYEMLGRVDDARAAYRAALQRDPADADAAAALARLR